MANDLISRKPARGIVLPGLIQIVRDIWDDLRRLYNGEWLSIVSVTGAGAIPAGANHVRVTTVSAAIVLTLPPSADVSPGHTVSVVVGIGAGASTTNNVTISPDGTDVICGDNSSGSILFQENECWVTLRYAGSGTWDVISMVALA